MNLSLHLLIILCFFSYLIVIGFGAFVLSNNDPSNRSIISGSLPHWIAKRSPIIIIISLATVLTISLSLNTYESSTGELLAQNNSYYSSYYVAVLLAMEVISWSFGLRGLRDRVWLSFLGLGVLLAMSILSHITPAPIVSPSSIVTKVLLMGHLITAILAEVCLFLIALVSAALFAVDRKIRLMNLSALADGELSLVRLDNLYGASLGGGFLSMTVSVISGAVLALVSHVSPTFDLTLLFALLSWIILAILLYLRVYLRKTALSVAGVLRIGLPIFFFSYLAIAIIIGDLFHNKISVG